MIKGKKKTGFKNSVPVKERGNFVSVCLTERVHSGTDVDGAAQQRASLQGPADDAVEVGGRFPQLVHLRHAAREVLEALRRAAARQRLITAVQPGTQTGEE